MLAIISRTYDRTIVRSYAALKTACRDSCRGVGSGFSKDRGASARGSQRTAGRRPARGWVRVSGALPRRGRAPRRPRKERGGHSGVGLAGAVSTTGGPGPTGAAGIRRLPPEATPTAREPHVPRQDVGARRASWCTSDAPRSARVGVPEEAGAAEQRSSGSRRIALSTAPALWLEPVRPPPSPATSFGEPVHRPNQRRPPRSPAPPATCPVSAPNRIACSPLFGR
jgi:hypothetical protein